MLPPDHFAYRKANARNSIDRLIAETWRSHAAGLLTDAEAQRRDEMLRAQQGKMRAPPARGAPSIGDALRRVAGGRR